MDVPCSQQEPCPRSLLVLYSDAERNLQSAQGKKLLALFIYLHTALQLRAWIPLRYTARDHPGTRDDDDAIPSSQRRRAVWPAAELLSNALRSPHLRCISLA